MQVLCLAKLTIVPRVPGSGYARVRVCPVISTLVFGQDRYNPSNAPFAFRFILRRYTSSLTQQTQNVNSQSPRLTRTLLPRIMTTLKATMKNLFKASNMSAVVATLVAAAELESRAATRPENTNT